MRSSNAPPNCPGAFWLFTLPLPVPVGWIAFMLNPPPAPLEPVGVGLSIWLSGTGIPAAWGCESSELPPNRSMSSSSGLVLLATDAMADRVAVEVVCEVNMLEEEEEGSSISSKSSKFSACWPATTV